MPRLADIHAAFVAVIQLSPKDYRYLSTDSFIGKMREFNWHFTRADANTWIGATSQTSRIRQLTVPTITTGSCAIWGGFTNGISFTGDGLR